MKLVPSQEVALVEDQLSVADCPEVIDVGDAERVAVGAGVPATTVTVTEEGAEVPPGPEHVTE
jgi:hypothetical protein